MHCFGDGLHPTISIIEPETQFISHWDLKQKVFLCNRYCMCYMLLTTSEQIHWNSKLQESKLYTWLTVFFPTRIIFFSHTLLTVDRKLLTDRCSGGQSSTLGTVKTLKYFVKGHLILPQLQSKSLYYIYKINFSGGSVQNILFGK